MELLIEYRLEKDYLLQITRDTSFEEIVVAIADEKILDVLDKPLKTRYKSEYLLIINVKGYAWVVPFVIKKQNTIFLKTAYPSTKFTKKYLKK